MLPQPQYDGDWEIQAEEEEQQQQQRVAGRRRGEEEEEEVDDDEDAWEAEGHLRRLRPHLSLNFAAAAAANNANGSCRNIHPHTGHTAEEDTVRRRLGQPNLRCPALVLNQDLTPLTLFPLTIAPWWSAVRSTLRGRVSVLENYDRRVRSTHALHQLPSVVALTRQQTPSHNYKHFGASASSSSCNGVEGEMRVVEEDVLPASRIPKPFRRNVALRDGYVCCFCGRRLSYRTLTLDHVTPKCRGGEDSWENLASACMQCNSRKGSLRVSELGQINMRLLKAPYAPTALQASDFRKGEFEWWCCISPIISFCRAVLVHLCLFCPFLNKPSHLLHTHPHSSQLAYAYVDLLPSTILTQWGRYLEGPLAREAAKLRAFHAAFSLPPSLPSSSLSSPAAAAASPSLAPFQRLEEGEGLPRVVVTAAVAAAAATTTATGVEEEEGVAPLSVPFALST